MIKIKYIQGQTELFVTENDWNSIDKHQKGEKKWQNKKTAKFNAENKVGHIFKLVTVFGKEDYRKIV